MKIEIVNTTMTIDKLKKLVEGAKAGKELIQRSDLSNQEKVAKLQEFRIALSHKRLEANELLEEVKSLIFDLNSI